MSKPSFSNPAVNGIINWEYLHTLAFLHEESPNQERQQRILRLLQNFLISCTMCQGHYDNYLQLHPPDLQTKGAFSRWMVELHNDVNRRLGKPEISYEQAKARHDWKLQHVTAVHILYETDRMELVDSRTLLPLSPVQMRKWTDLHLPPDGTTTTTTTMPTKTTPDPNNTDTFETCCYTMLLVFAIGLGMAAIFYFGRRHLL